MKNVIITEKIFANFRAVSLEWFLDITKHKAQFLFHLSTQMRGRQAIQLVNDMRGMLIIFVETEFLQDMAHLGVIDVFKPLNTRLVDLCNDFVIDILGNIRRFFPLNLIEAFVERYTSTLLAGGSLLQTNSRSHLTH